MKRRLFLQGLLGASAIAPVIAKAVTKPDDIFGEGFGSKEPLNFGLAKARPEGGRSNADIGKFEWKFNRDSKGFIKSIDVKEKV